VRDRTFGPVVLGGLAAAALTAVAAAQDWGEATGDNAGVAVTGRADGAATAPLALALALVALASWGVLLVLRGRLRGAVAAVGVLAAAGVVAAVVLAYGDVDATAVEATRAAGATSDVFETSRTGWYWTALVAGVVSLVALAVAALRAPGWPAMGGRYDSPATRDEASTPRTDEDLWKALDEGRDPTA
jgi:uncharacterized membrane protein (TIGR02234 family)